MTRIVIYSLQDCPRCEELKTWLRAAVVPFEEMDMNSPVGITDLRVNQCFAMEAQVLRVGDRFLASEDIWPCGILAEAVLRQVIS